MNGNRVATATAGCPARRGFCCVGPAVTDFGSSRYMAKAYGCATDALFIRHNQEELAPRGAKRIRTATCVKAISHSLSQSVALLDPPRDARDVGEIIQRVSRKHQEAGLIAGSQTSGPSPRQDGLGRHFRPHPQQRSSRHHVQRGNVLRFRKRILAVRVGAQRDFNVMRQQFVEIKGIAGQPLAPTSKVR